MKIAFSLDSEYSSHGRERIREDNLALVPGADLRWYYFLGRLSITHAGIEIGPSWGWVPMFDAMYSVRQVMMFVQGRGGLGRIDFTENDEVIDFKKDQRQIRIIPTYKEAEIRCSVDDFLAAGSEFIRERLLYAIDEFPSLAHNGDIQTLAQDIGLGKA